MIPYFRLTALPLGPIVIQVWGLFVASGILAAAWLGSREARRLGLKAEAWLDLSAWMVLAAIVGARLFYALFYAPAYFASEPLAVVRIWDGGMSIWGGFVGAGAAALIYARRRKLELRRYLDLAAFVLPLGCAIGRLGCFLIHDHPGTLSRSFLSVAFPDGARLDHGLLLSLLNLAIFLFFLLLRRLARHPVPYLAWYALLYGLARFYLDFYRAWDLAGSDVRLWSLTPAQYLSVLAAAFGFWLLLRSRRNAVRPAAA